MSKILNATSGWQTLARPQILILLAEPYARHKTVYLAVLLYNACPLTALKGGGRERLTKGQEDTNTIFTERTILSCSKHTNDILANCHESKHEVLTSTKKILVE